jgi:dTMP kinase
VFITFEGTEGSGKSTQLGRLAAALRTRNVSVTTTREPGGTPVGEHIRRLLTDPSGPELSATAELFLYLADRTQHVRDTVRPALAAGHVVICDRFSDSTIAYQGYGRGGDLDLVRHLDAIARDGCSPDLTFLLTCPVRVGLERTRTRSSTGPREDRFEQESEAFHERVLTGFHELAHMEPARFAVLDATQPVDRVESAILTETLRRLPGGLAS